MQVIDTGIGIANEECKKIFEQFYKVDNPALPQSGGTGIGLSIAKSFVELHKGHIWVESEVGKGSIFSFTLPVKV